jgi:hypothetical protein
MIYKTDCKCGQKLLIIAKDGVKWSENEFVVCPECGELVCTDVLVEAVWR